MKKGSSSIANEVVEVPDRHLLDSYESDLAHAEETAAVNQWLVGIRDQEIADLETKLAERDAAIVRLALGAAR